MLPPFPRPAASGIGEFLSRCISGVRRWMAYAIAAWTGSFLRQATMSSQMLHTRMETWAASSLSILRWRRSPRFRPTSPAR